MQDKVKKRPSDEFSFMLKVEPADVTVNDSILRLLFNSTVAKWFMMAVFATGTFINRQ
jgi:hypothetical protein